MEKANNEKIKEIFLAVFVLLCVGLILTLWTNAFVEKDAETPYFYRGVPALSASYYATRTAVAEQIILGTVEPTVEKKHKEPSVTPTLASSATPTLAPSATPQIINFTPESDN